VGERYVIDASALIQGYIADSDTKRVLSLLKQLFEPNPIELHIPEFCLLECSNILWKQVRFHGMPLVDAQKALTSLLSTPMTVHSASPFLARALAIATTHQLAVYDSIYIALSEKLGYPLVSVDSKQTQVATAVGLTLKALSDFPELQP
jgi:predicted nucleic acid-binding protein